MLFPLPFLFCSLLRSALGDNVRSVFVTAGILLRLQHDEKDIPPKAICNGYTIVCMHFDEDDIDDDTL
jgi:hypothetical protein